MAHYFLFPEKDTTIYSHTRRADVNMGIDEVLTLNDELYLNERYPSRVLIQFKSSELKDVINNKVTGEFSASLKLFQTEHKSLSETQELEIYPLAQGPWVNGTGRFSNYKPIKNGASWRYINNSDSDTRIAWDTDTPPAGATSSMTSSGTAGGAVWYTGSGFEVTKSYEYNEDLDLNFDLTPLVTKHYSSSQFSSTYPDGITNYGFILKRSYNQEFGSTEHGELNYFSMDTHTIYPPLLDISWDDSIYDTSSASNDKILKSGDIYVTLRNNKGEFRQSEETKFRLNVRELYPTRKFVTSSNYLDIKYFTSESYYSLIDYATEETIIPFDEHTKLSADSEGMYFKLYMGGLQAERYYKLLFKHENNDGVNIYDENYYFKVKKS